jgi:hypothetical protein
VSSKLWDYRIEVEMTNKTNNPYLTLASLPAHVQ